MNKFGAVSASHVAGVSLREGNFGKLMEEAKGGWLNTTLFVLGFAATFLGGWGLAANLGVERVRTKLAADRQKEVLAKYYQNEVHATLGDRKTDAEASVGDLEMAAKYNPMLQRAIQKVDEEQDSANRAGMLSVAGGAALGAAAGGLGLLPVGSGIAHTVAKVGVDLTGAIGGSMLGDAIFADDTLQVLDVVTELDKKLAETGAIDASDIAILRIAQDPEWQKAFQKQNKQSFAALNEQQRRQIVAAMPDVLLGAAKQAEAVNRGLISVQNVVMSGAAKGSNFTDKVGGSRAPKERSFVKQVQARRAEVPTQGVQMGAV